MTRWFVLVFVGICLVVGVTAFAKQTPVRQPQCVLRIGVFDLGWVHATDVGSYRCVPTFDSGLKLSGAAWTKVNFDGTLGVVLPK